MPYLQVAQAVKELDSPAMATGRLPIVLGAM